MRSGAGSMEIRGTKGLVDAPLLEVQDLEMHFSLKGGGIAAFLMGWRRYVRAVDGVNLTVRRHETLGLVGESGCGKSTLGRTIARLYKPTGGRILFGGHDITGMSYGDLIPIRSRLQIVFQDPYSSLNPRKTVADIVGLPLEVHGIAITKPERLKLVEAVLNKVGLGGEHLTRYPHEFSGGQRQRIGIARAIALRPEFVIADEVVSGLDVSVQAQILNLLKDLQGEMGLSFLFISHDLGVIRQVSHRVAVMYLGKVVEMAPAEELFSTPLHPYTQVLMTAHPVPDLDVAWKPTLLSGEPPSPVNIPSGCRFNPRCPKQEEICSRVEPELRKVAPGHLVACHLVEEKEA